MITFYQSMSGTLKSPVTMTLGRVSFDCGIFCKASSSCCTSCRPRVNGLARVDERGACLLFQ